MDGRTKKLSSRVFIAIQMLLVLNSCDRKNEIVNDKSNGLPKTEKFLRAEISKTRMLHGQSVYVPIYSSIYNRYENNLLHLTAILSIRNISPESEIVISEISYHDTNGKLIKNYIDGPFNLGKLASKEFVIPENDLSGGTGANFLVKWMSDTFVAAPIIEAVMIGEHGTKGFSFTSRGKEIESQN